MPIVNEAGLNEIEARGRKVVSFVHRGGRMTHGQAHAWDRRWAEYGLELPPMAAAAPGRLDLAGWFGRDAPVIMEIGSGMGESTAALAAAAPELDHLAVEIYQPGLAQLLMRIDARGLTNLRLVRGDAVEVLADRIEPDRLAGIRVYFPDPWPKRRHHKRRLITPEFAALAASRLRPGATLHLATDWAHYAEAMREVCEAEPLLCNCHPDAGSDDGSAGGWAPRPDWRPLTKFEQRAGLEGRQVRDLIYQRI